MYQVVKLVFGNQVSGYCKKPGDAQECGCEEWGDGDPSAMHLNRVPVFGVPRIPGDVAGQHRLGDTGFVEFQRHAPNLIMHSA